MTLQLMQEACKKHAFKKLNNKKDLSEEKPLYINQRYNSIFLLLGQCILPKLGREKDAKHSKMHAYKGH